MIINNRVLSKVIEEGNKLLLPIDRIYVNFIQNNNKSYSCHPSLVTVNNYVFSNTEITNTTKITNKYYRKNRININDFE